MRRMQLIEIHDQPWFPGFLRDQVTDAHAHVAGRADGQPVSCQPPAEADELLTGDLQVRIGMHYNGMLDGRPTKK